MIRLVGLSATLPNFEDVAAFLRVDPAQVPDRLCSVALNVKLYDVLIAFILAMGISWGGILWSL
jgi:replicative superfamily II helicase